MKLKNRINSIKVVKEVLVLDLFWIGHSTDGCMDIFCLAVKLYFKLALHLAEVSSLICSNSGEATQHRC